MIGNKKKITIGTDVKYLSDWKDEFGGLMIDHHVCSGRYLINKGCTGCGYTSLCLNKPENTILVSPRKSLIRNKFEQSDKCHYQCFYYNREVVKDDDPLKGCRYFDTLGNTEWLMREYIDGCQTHCQPMKFMVIYDSFSGLASMLEYIGIDISRTFKIVIDESHCIVKDAHMKQRFGKKTLSVFIQNLFKYENLQFISATPIKKYMQKLQAFKDNDVQYIQLRWESQVPIEFKTTKCKGSMDAFDQIFKIYEKNTDPWGNHVFDARHYGNGQSFYSYEAIIFLNNVNDIVKILNKYICKKKLVLPTDVTLICSPSAENEKLLTKSKTGVHICEHIPKEGERHTTWTFVTKNSFEGCDFYSETGSTYVIANYNVSSLCLSIESDIPQIIGRQRLARNIFKNILHVFYTNRYDIDEQEYLASRQSKTNASHQMIADFRNISPAGRVQQMKMIDSYIETHPDELYISTVNGFPEFDDILMTEEEMCYDIIKGNIGMYTRAEAQSKLHQNYSQITQNLLTQLTEVTSDTTDKTTSLRLRMCVEVIKAFTSLEAEIYDMLNKNGYSYLSYYLTTLPLNRIEANGYDTWKMNREISGSLAMQAIDVSAQVRASLVPGQVYSKKDVKVVIQSVYDANGICRTAKATDLDDLQILYQGAKDANGNKGVRII